MLPRSHPVPLEYGAPGSRSSRGPGRVIPVHFQALITLAGNTIGHVSHKCKVGRSKENSWPSQAGNTHLPPVRLGALNLFSGLSLEAA